MRAGSWSTSGTALTVATHAERVDVDLGVIETGGERITGFREKPQLDYEASLGIYVYDDSALTHLQLRPLFRAHAAAARARGNGPSLRSEADWFDIGTWGQHQRAVEAFERAGGFRHVSGAELERAATAPSQSLLRERPRDAPAGSP
jgi:NDP-sugar pyrophosphorylase family protein